jgi:hypothetical protein
MQKKKIKSGQSDRGSLVIHLRKYTVLTETGFVNNLLLLTQLNSPR